MAWDESFNCDICGKAKLESNHWWLVTTADVLCSEEDQPSKRFTLIPWNEAESRNPDLHHLCGEGCATKALERFMSTGKLEPEAYRDTANR